MDLKDPWGRWLRQSESQAKPPAPPGDPRESPHGRCCSRPHCRRPLTGPESPPRTSETYDGNKMTYTYTICTHCGWLNVLKMGPAAEAPPAAQAPAPPPTCAVCGAGHTTEACEARLRDLLAATPPVYPWTPKEA